MLAVQIAFGIWLGGLCLFGTVWLAIETIRKLDEKIARNRRIGAPWYSGLLRS